MDTRLNGANEWGAVSLCEYCEKNAVWTLHGHREMDKDHIGVCGKTPCVDKAEKDGYCACGCGG